MRALTIRIGFGGPLYYKYNKEPQTSIGSYLGPYVLFYSCSPGPGGVSPRGRPVAGEKRTPKNSSPGTPKPLNEALSLYLAYPRQKKPLKRKVKLSDSYCN